MKFTSGRIASTVVLLVSVGCVCGDIILAQWLFSYLPDLSWLFGTKLGISVLVVVMMSGIVTYAVSSHRESVRFER